MDIYREEIARMVYEQKILLEDYTREYAAYHRDDAEDRLICCMNHGKETYYRAHRENGRYVRKSISNDQAVISELARKEYLRIAIDVIRKNVATLESSCSRLEDIDFDSIRDRMYKACRELPDEAFFGDGAGRGRIIDVSGNDRFRAHRAWAEDAYEKSDYMPERRRYMTSAGFRVRSKSEQHIVEQLVNYGVPFRYEQVIHIDSLRLSADFTFQDHNKELFYWEHAGMMDEPKYGDSHYRKMNMYESVGIVPWKNLIVTYDVDGVINIPMIKSVIENDVIPRM